MKIKNLFTKKDKRCKKNLFYTFEYKQKKLDREDHSLNLFFNPKRALRTTQWGDLNALNLEFQFKV